MQQRFLALALATSITATGIAALTPTAAGAAVPADLTPLVNTFIGTQDDGNTFPGAALPFGMVQVSPDTGWNVGYNYNHSKIWGFSNTHLSGVGCSSATEVSLMPTVGAVTSVDPTVYGQPLDHTKETASPGYYKVTTPNTVTTELTATLRTGWQKYTFPVGTSSNVLFNTAEIRGTDGNAPSSSVSIVGNDTVEGSVTQTGFCGGFHAPHTVYFSAKFERPFASFGTWRDTTLTAGNRAASGAGGNGGWVTFDTTTDRDIVVKVGLSYTGVAGARANLAGETSTSFDFEATKTAAHDTWNAKLHKIEVSGGTQDRQVAFYTSLYHSLLHPNVASDVDGTYMGFDNQVHTATGYTPYQTFSLWDTFRGQNQLVALLEPQVARDSALSLLAIDAEQGLLPRWSMYNTETNTMTGDPVTPFLIDIWARGLLNGKEAETYAALKKYATTTSTNVLVNGRGANLSYISRGYVPTDVSCSPNKSNSSDCMFPGSATLEYAAADSALAIMAESLGYQADADTFNARGQNFRNLWDNGIGTFHPKTNAGAWLTPYNPNTGANKFHEGSPYQYEWLVPQDPAGLIGLMGGNAAANAKLDVFFDYPNLLTDPSGTAHNSWVNGSYDYDGFKTYNPNNEPNLMAPFTYLWTGQPSKTATVLRAAFTLFTNAPNGVTGNDDLGAMSSWYVFSSIGLYPLMHGANFYGVTSPQFTDVKVNIGSYGTAQGGTLTISAPGTTDANRYINTAALNGTAFTKTWLSQQEIAHGGTIDYTVSTTPGSWGTAAADAPPSVNHATTPAPSPSTDMAMLKSATGSAPCSASQGPEKAVNGSATGGTSDAFCSTAASAYVQVDLGTVRPVDTFTIKHAGAGGESSSLNTKAFNIQTSTDGTTWTPAVTVTNNTANTSTHTIPSVDARYIKLNVTTPTQTTDTTSRVYELEVYGTPRTNLALNKPATGSTACSTSEGPAKAVNGTVTGGGSDKFCSLAAPSFLQVDLGSVVPVDTFTIQHAGAGGEASSRNTKAFNIQTSTDAATWTTAVTVTNNTANTSSHTVPSVSARYIKLNVTTPTQTTDAATRIYELEVNGTPVVNLALNKAATGSTVCSASEGPAKAVNGSVAGGSSDKFCSLAAGSYLQVDLGTARPVDTFTIQHAGAGGEAASRNTKAFNIQTSTDAVTWTTAVTVTNNTANTSSHTVAPVNARYIKLNVTTPTQTTDAATRIYELEVFGGAPVVNLALNKVATGSTACSANEGPAKAVNGSVTGGNSDKFCSTVASSFLQVDLGSAKPVSKVVVQHASAGGESSSFNTKAFTIQTSTDGTTWSTVATVTANTAGTTTHPIATTTARYVRLNITTPTQTTNTATRIYELEVY